MIYLSPGAGPSQASVQGPPKYRLLRQVPPQARLSVSLSPEQQWSGRCGNILQNSQIRSHFMDLKSSQSLGCCKQSGSNFLNDLENRF